MKQTNEKQMKRQATNKGILMQTHTGNKQRKMRKETNTGNAQGHRGKYKETTKQRKPRHDTNNGNKQRTTTKETVT